MHVTKPGHALFTPHGTLLHDAPACLFLPFALHLYWFFHPCLPMFLSPPLSSLPSISCHSLHVLLSHILPTSPSSSILSPSHRPFHPTLLMSLLPPPPTLPSVCCPSLPFLPSHILPTASDSSFPPSSLLPTFHSIPPFVSSTYPSILTWPPLTSVSFCISTLSHPRPPFPQSIPVLFLSPPLHHLFCSDPAI